MRIIGKEKLADFKRVHPDAKAQISAWEAEVEDATWKTPHDLKSRYPKASLPGKQQAIFDISWNRYRIWTRVAYQAGVVLIKGVGTHKEYDKWNIE